MTQSSPLLIGLSAVMVAVEADASEDVKGGEEEEG